MKKILIPLLAVLLTAGLAGCTTNPDGSISQQTAGTAIGGVTGGILGAAVGSGSSRALTTGIGAVVGAVAGSSIGKYMDEQKMDQQSRMNTAHAVVDVPVGQEATWNGGDTYYTVRPMNQYVVGRRECRKILIVRKVWHRRGGYRTIRTIRTMCRPIGTRIWY